MAEEETKTEGWAEKAEEFPEADPLPSYATDDPSTVYEELKKGERLIYGGVSRLNFFAEQAARASVAYSTAKEEMKISMFDEETAGTVKKRTIEQRAAIYRVALKDKKLQMEIAANDFKAAFMYVEGLIGAQNSIESRAKLISIDERFAGRRYT